MPKAQHGINNPNYKGGVCSITHDDELLEYPEYLESRKQKILSSYTVDDNGCWVWAASIFKRSGRARISTGVRSTCAARVAYIAFNQVPIGDLLVCHSCDNILCVNPDHLWLGTNADNSKDMVNKGRTHVQKGECNNYAKLTENSVRAIRALLDNGIKQYIIAEQFGVTKSLISQIHNKLIWRHVN